MLVDFATRQRALADKIIKRSRIDGDEIVSDQIPGFAGVSFVFRSDSVAMISTRITPNTVRVNNQPVTDTMTIHDGSLIGASGRLYYFRYLLWTDDSPDGDESPE